MAVGDTQDGPATGLRRPFWSLTPTKIFAVTLATIALTLAYGVYVGKIGAALNEKSFATFFSVALLWTTSRVCFRIHRVKTTDAPGGGHARDARVVWLFLGYSFAFLALDELLQIHENLDKFIHFITGMEETGLSDRIDDLILLIYGLVGLIVLFIYRSEILSAPRLMYFLRVAFCFAVVSLVLDVISADRSYLTWLQVPENLHDTVRGWVKLLEEGTKLLTEAALLSGFVELLRSLSPALGAANADMPAEH